jgi:hypothetical protein
MALFGAGCYATLTHHAMTPTEVRA